MNKLQWKKHTVCWYAYLMWGMSQFSKFHSMWTWPGLQEITHVPHLVAPPTSSMLPLKLESYIGFIPLCTSSAPYLIFLNSCVTFSHLLPTIVTFPFRRYDHKKHHHRHKTTITQSKKSYHHIIIKFQLNKHKTKAKLNTILCHNLVMLGNYKLKI